MTGLRFSPAELAARVVNDRGAVRHGCSNLGLSARVATPAGRVGVVVWLLGSPLELGVVWLPAGRTSRTAAAVTARAHRAGLRPATAMPAAGLVAVEAWLDPDPESCVYSDPYHLGTCVFSPQLSVEAMFRPDQVSPAELACRPLRVAIASLSAREQTPTVRRLIAECEELLASLVDLYGEVGGR